MDLSIIIVNYNTKKLTLDCIKSIYKSKTNYQYEILVVDNNSRDDSVRVLKDTFKNIILIQNKENVGFAKANNQAMKISKGRYILLLNSDTIVRENTLDTIIKFMEENDDVGSTGCKVVLPNGELDKACHRGFPTPEASFFYMTGLAKRFPNNPKFNSYHKSYLHMDEIHEIDCLVGAFMMVRRKTIEEVGMLDETYFMYGEDIDWCYRIKKAGWKIYFNPNVSIVHYKGASSRKKPFKIVYEFYRAMFIFHKNHFASKYNMFINLLVYLGITLKLSLAIITNGFKRSRELT